MKLANCMIEDGLKNFGPYNSFQYIRLMTEQNNVNSLSIIDKLLENSVPFLSNISTNDIEDGRKYFGEFVNISGIFLYKQNIVVTKGTLKFRNRDYDGLEFLASQQISLKDEVTKFMTEVNKDLTRNIDYKLTPSKQVGI